MEEYGHDALSGFSGVKAWESHFDQHVVPGDQANVLRVTKHLRVYVQVYQSNRSRRLIGSLCQVCLGCRRVCQTYEIGKLQRFVPSTLVALDNAHPTQQITQSLLLPSTPLPLSSPSSIFCVSWSNLATMATALYFHATIFRFTPEGVDVLISRF